MYDWYKWILSSFVSFLVFCQNNIATINVLGPGGTTIHSCCAVWMGTVWHYRLCSVWEPNYQWQKKNNAIKHEKNILKVCLTDWPLGNRKNKHSIFSFSFGWFLEYAKTNKSKATKTTNKQLTVYTPFKHA
jgi:hypothetical protein